MIATLRGRVTTKGDAYTIVEVGGIGFRVHVAQPCLDGLGNIGQEVSLFTYLHVRENELTLYGFATPEDLQLFELLLGVSGIGPRTALRIVSLISAEDLQTAISRGDAAALARIPGIGKRTAERLMIELKDKLGVSLEFVSYPALSYADAEVISALTSLGYSVSEAQAAVRALPKEDLPLEERVRLALQQFAGQ